MPRELTTYMWPDLQKGTYHIQTQNLTYFCKEKYNCSIVEGDYLNGFANLFGNSLRDKETISVLQV